jgi:putative ABC transport system ATP-binding protein
MDSITATAPLTITDLGPPLGPVPGPRTRTLVDARGLTRVWGSGHGASRALDGVDLELGVGEFVAVVGPSGSGKSTLGALLAGIDKPTSGSLVIGEVRLDRMREDALARWRSRHLGIVLQDFSLLPTLTAAENVELGLRLAGVRKDRRRRAREALDRVGLGGLARRLPVQLSGGEQQRVAIARAIARRPQILVADEPTGSLDTANGEIVFRLIRDLAAGGTTVVFITHDPGLAAATPRVVTLVDGRVESDCRNRDGLSS